MLANLSGQALEVSGQDDLGGAVDGMAGPEGGQEAAQVVIASHPDPALPDAAGNLTLRPWESVVLRLTR